MQPVAVSSELMTVLERAFAVSELTDGAFDISFASCGGLWSIRERRIPSDDELAACLQHVDFRQGDDWRSCGAATGTQDL